MYDTYVFVYHKIFIYYIAFKVGRTSHSDANTHNICAK